MPDTRSRFGSQELWIVTDPEIVETVLLKHVKDYRRDRRLMRLNRGPGPHRFQYLPFLDCPKKCLGGHFAMMETRLTIPTLLQRLRFEYAGKRPPRPIAGLTMSVDGGMPMRARRV